MWLLWLVVSILVAQNAAAGPLYHIQPLTLPGSVASAAYGINNHGQVVGSLQTQDGASNAFLWSTSGVTEVARAVGVATVFYRINNQGIIAGTADGVGFVYEHNTFVDFSVSTPTGPALTFVNAINNLGDLAGYYHDDQRVPRLFADGTPQSFIKTAAAVTALDIMGYDYDFALDINDHRQVIGSAVQRQGGMTVGYIYESGNIDFVSYPGTQVTNLRALNNTGTILGMAGEGPAAFPFIYRHGTFEVLSGFEGMPAVVSGINDFGVIVGTLMQNGQEVAFMASPVPEPATWALFASAVLVLLGVRQRCGPACKQHKVGSLATAFLTTQERMTRF